jgi:hypothetical protein
MENQMYSSTTMIQEAEALNFDPSVLNIHFNLRDVDDYDTYEVTKGDVGVFAHNNGGIPTLEMFEKLVEAQEDQDDLWQKFMHFCNGGN